jgi:hypothetical protein
MLFGETFAVYFENHTEQKKFWYEREREREREKVEQYMKVKSPGKC